MTGGMDMGSYFSGEIIDLVRYLDSKVFMGNN